MVDVVAAPRQAKTDASLRTLAGISTAHWVSHFHFTVPPMLFPFLKEQLGVDYLELGFALTVFAVISALTQAPMGYLADHIGARKVLLMGLTLGGFALIMIGLHLSYSGLIASAVLLGLANSVYHPADYAILSAHMDDACMGRAFSIHTFAGFFGGAVAPAIVAALVATIGGYGALIVAGAVGPLVALLLAVVVADGGDDDGRIPRRRDRALARYAGPRRRTGRRGRARIRYCHHRLHSRRYRQPAAVWLDHGSELAAMGVRCFRRVYDSYGVARACHRPRPAGQFRGAGCKADASLSLMSGG